MSTIVTGPLAVQAAVTSVSTKRCRSTVSSHNVNSSSNWSMTTTTRLSPGVVATRARSGEIEGARVALERTATTPTCRWPRTSRQAWTADERRVSSTRWSSRSCPGDRHGRWPAAGPPGSPTTSRCRRGRRPRAVAFPAVAPAGRRRRPRGRRRSRCRTAGRTPGPCTADARVCGARAPDGASSSSSTVNTGSRKPLMPRAPTVSNAKSPRESTSSATSSDARICPGAAVSQRRRTTTTGVPTYSPASWMGSPTCIPMRIAIGSSFVRLRSATAFRIASAQRSAWTALENAANMPPLP